MATGNVVKIDGLLPFQERVFDALWVQDAPGVILNGGRNVGKTFCGILMLAHAIGTGRREIAVWEPTNDMLNRIMTTYCGPDGTVPTPGPRAKIWRMLMPGRWVQNRNRYECDSGATINLYSAEAYERCAGIHFDYIWADEFGQYGTQAIQSILENWGTEQAGDLHCKLFTSSTPYGWDDAYCRIVENPPPGFQVFHATSVENIYKFNPKIMERLRQTMDEATFRMKYLGEMVNREGLVFSWPIEQRLHEVPEDWHPSMYVGGLDFGWSHPAAFVLIGIDDNGRVGVIDELYGSEIPIHELGHRIRAVIRSHGIGADSTVIYADAARPDDINELNMHCGLTVVKANKNVLDGISRVNKAIAWGAFALTGLTNFWKDIDRYVWHEERQAVVKKHDDAADALRYAIMGLPGIFRQDSNLSTAVSFKTEGPIDYLGSVDLNRLGDGDDELLL